MSKQSNHDYWIEDYLELREDGNLYTGFTLKREQWLNPKEHTLQEIKTKVKDSLIEQSARFTNAFSNYTLLLYDGHIKIPKTVEADGRTKLSVVRNIDDHKK